MEEQLFRAIYDNKLKEVKRLLENGTVSATVTRSFGIWTWTLAGRAVAEGRLNILKYLVKKELSLLTRKTVEEHGVYQEGLLDIACNAGHFDIVKYLVEECEADIFEECPRFGDDYNVMNPVYSAARGGHLEIFKYLLEKGNVDVNAPFRPRKDAPKDIKYPKSLLYLADRLKNPPKVLEYLLKETNIDVPTTDENGNSILFNENIVRNTTIVKIVLDKYGDKFDIDAKNNNGETLLHHFISDSNTCTVLNLTRYLVEEKGANITLADDKCKWTPLHFAAAHDHPEVCEYLINRGVSVDPQDKDGDTPLHITALAGHINLCKVLIKHGANMNQKNNKGDSPLHYAINRHCKKRTPATWSSRPDTRRNASEVFIYLVNCNADVTQKNNEGKTPLDCLIAKGDLNGLKHLIENGIVDVGKKNENCESLVHLAVIYNQVPILDYLVRIKHADIETTRSMQIRGSYNADTPLLTALSMKHYESSKYLIKYGAKPPHGDDLAKEAGEMISQIKYELHSGRTRRSIMSQTLSIDFQKQNLHTFNDYGSLVLEEANRSNEGVAVPFFSTVTRHASQFCGFLSLTHLLISNIKGSTYQQKPIFLQERPGYVTVQELIYSVPDFIGIHSSRF